MRFYLISDNVDTQVGMRLAGIEGVVVHEPEEVKKSLTEAMAMDDVAVILITERLLQLCPEMIYDLKLKAKRPLIVENPRPAWQWPHQRFHYPLCPRGHRD